MVGAGSFFHASAFFASPSRIRVLRSRGRKHDTELTQLTSPTRPPAAGTTCGSLDASQNAVLSKALHACRCNNVLGNALHTT